MEREWLDWIIRGPDLKVVYIAMVLGMQTIGLC